MKLSRAAADTWRAHRAALHRIAGDEAEPSRLLLGGGTILNARWGHRESVDIDLLLPERRTLHDLRPGRRLDLAAAVAGEVIRQTEHRITVLTPDGVVDVTAMQPPLAGRERRMNVEGGIETVLSTAQILRGKLERIRKALPRDAFDLIVAAKTDPPALESAVNSLSPDQRVTAKEHLRQSNARIASAAGSALAGVPDRHRTPHETMGLDAARALHEHEYTRVQIYAAGNGIIILTVPRHGTPRTATMENDPEAALRNSGIAEYLDANSTVSSYEVEKALHVLGRPAETRLLLDTDDDDPRERIRRCLSPS